MPGVYHATYGEAASVAELFATTCPAEDVAAIVVEPVLGEGGYIVPPAEFLPGLRALCDRHGILLVFDEVQSGMGRTGKMFAAEHTGVVPDVLLLAKGIASGMPLGAMMARREVMTWGPGTHGSTIAGNPVAIAAGMATLDLLESTLVDNSARVGALLKARLGERLAGCRHRDGGARDRPHDRRRIHVARHRRGRRPALLPPRPPGAGVRPEGDPDFAPAHLDRRTGRYDRRGVRARHRRHRARSRPRMSDLTQQQAARVFYTWTAQAAATPLEIVGGEGARFVTADGARWWDLGSMTWNAPLGHGHPRMKAALAEAAGRGLLTIPSGVFPDKVRAAQLLAEVTPPGLEKTFFCLSGAEANENAVKMARLITGRQKIVARTRSYHGATLAMLSLSGDPRREPFEPGLPGVVRMGDPYCFRCPWGKEPTSCAHECAGDLEVVLQREGPETVAAVILEGVVGANGVFTPPLGYWRKVRDICDRHGILLIADEVLSGFGRTGRWFAVDHDGVTPDLMTMAKGITGGYAPGGAVIVTERVARHFDEHVLVCGSDQLRAPAGLRGHRRRHRDAAGRAAGRARGGAGAASCATAWPRLARARPVIADVREAWACCGRWSCACP